MLDFIIALATAKNVAFGLVLLPYMATPITCTFHCTMFSKRFLRHQNFPRCSASIANCVWYSITVLFSGFVPQEVPLRNGVNRDSLCLGMRHLTSKNHTVSG